jgi:hypothetical protein
MKSHPSKAPRYHLRFQVLPGSHTQRDALELKEFCLQHRVEEVVLFFAAEEWNNGLLSRLEEDVWFDTVRTTVRILAKAGIAVSLNPWMTDLGPTRGRTFPKDRAFAPAVSPLGEVSKGVASFADPVWQQYVWDLYGRFATLGFRVIWIEDDFRYHNHSPLTWGSGFDPLTLDRFAKKVGQAVTREEVVRNILAPGTPHPWRTLWMENWSEIQLEVARGLAEAIRRNSPGGTRLGLMSSQTATHSIEGRDWHALFDALSVEGQVAHRPHFAPYAEQTGQNKCLVSLALDSQRPLRPADCEVAPEIENFPMTCWTKSDAQTWSEMAVAQFFASDALLLDLFPFAANPASEEPRIGRLLDLSRPALEWIGARFSKSLTTRGVGTPWRDDAQARVHTPVGKALTELDANAWGPCQFLAPYGVSITAGRQAVNGLFGSLAWSFDDREMNDLLSGGLLLDGISADILCQRGFGDLIGIQPDGFVKRESSTYALEVIASTRTGLRKGHYAECNRASRVLKISRLLEGTEEWTTLINPEKERIGAAVVAFVNRLGGRVVTYAVPNPASLNRTFQRQILAHQAVRFLAANRFDAALAAGSPFCTLVHFEEPGRAAIVISNGSPDAALPEIRIGSIQTRPSAATLLCPLEKPRKVSVKATVGPKGVVIQTRDPIPFHGFLVLEWETRGK